MSVALVRWTLFHFISSFILTTQMKNMTRSTDTSCNLVASFHWLLRQRSWNRVSWLRHSCQVILNMQHISTWIEINKYARKAIPTPPCLYKRMNLWGRQKARYHYIQRLCLSFIRGHLLMMTPVRTFTHNFCAMLVYV
jgi:hypothetical protein